VCAVELTWAIEGEIQNFRFQIEAEFKRAGGTPALRKCSGGFRRGWALGLFAVIQDHDEEGVVVATRAKSILGRRCLVLLCCGTFASGIRRCGRADTLVFRLGLGRWGCR